MGSSDRSPTKSENGETQSLPEEYWHRSCMKKAQQVGLLSKDPSTKVGCVIARDRQVLVTGYNGLPRGVNSAPERLERPEKYFWFEHAERNAIYVAAEFGVQLAGATLYTVAEPGIGKGICADCARAVIQTGISEAWVQPPEGAGTGRWDASIQAGIAMLAEAGVRLRYLKL